MREKIGNVVLDDTCYPGEDRYSDGDIEDELLAIAKSCKNEADCNAVIAEKKSWPVMYHFSHIRHNLLSWLSITGQDRVLEIGSGCGAVTGALAAKAKSVTCIDLSRRRSLVNAWRNRDFDNITILLGAFDDVEKTLTDTYDYITLIGVFEYGAIYTGESNPYVSMLRRIARHLAPGGKIVIAIENRLGLKYWAGCTEDHVGRLFEGLEGYSRTPSPGPRTFSKSELEQIFAEAGEFETTFYYPYPDYKFPTAIYSDRYLPRRGDLKSNRNNFDRRRLLLFDEGKVFDSLIDNGLFPQFANSFLVLLEAPGPANTDSPNTADTLIYSKYSNDRSPAFSIRTDILEEEGGNRVVRKLAACPEAEAHAASLSHWYQVFTGRTKGTPLSYNRCTPVPGGVALEYLTGRSLEEELLAVWKEQGIDACAQKFMDFLQFVKSLHTGAVFAPCDAFRTVFGDVSLPLGTVCAPSTNIDLLCENIKLQDGKWVALDYEWSFDFPIPVNFLLYRIILHFTDHANRGTEFMRFDFMGQMGITREEITAFDAMEAHFQQYILGNHVPIQSMYNDISEGYLLVEEALAQESLQVFFNCGDGFREEDSALFPMRQGSCQYLAQEIPLPSNVRSIRIDPGNHAAMVHLDDLHFDTQSGQASFRLRDATRRGKWLYFPEDDPNLIIRRIPDGARSLFVKLEVYRMEQEPLRDAERAARGPLPKLPSLHKIKQSLASVFR